MLALKSNGDLCSRGLPRIIAVGLFALFCAAANAGILQFETTALGGDIWRYRYTLQGQAPSGGFDGLTVYFEPTSFGHLTNLAVPVDCDPLLIQPDIGIPADGFLDLLHLGGLLNGSFGPVEFSVDVEFLGNGFPGSQRFELYVSEPFDVVTSSETQQAAAVPEPATFALVATALGCILLGRLRTTE